MPFWSGADIEPKRQYRFTVSIAGMDGSNAEYYTKSVTKPSFTVTESNHQFLNHTFYYPGRVEWSKVSFTMVDPVDPDATGNLLSILKRSGYNVPGNLNEPDALSSIGKANSVGALGQVTIRGIDEDGNTLEQWTLNNPWILAVSFNDYAYDQDGLAEITLEVRYDWASYRIPGDRSAGDPQIVERNLFSLGS
jgi:hypothetical protein